MPKAARKTETFHYGTTCVFNYERCGPPMKGVQFPDYAAHGSSTGMCNPDETCSGGCIDVQLSTLGLPLPAGFGLFHAGHDDPAPIRHGWPSRPVVNPAIGRIIEDYRVKFKIIHLDGTPLGPERFAYVPLMEIYPTAGTADRIRIYGRGFEVRSVDPAECELILAVKFSEHRAVALLGEVVVHILLDAPA